MPSGNKYHVYIHDADAFHGLFTLATDNCPLPRVNVNQQKCDEMARWL
jgi:hypothetical protein